MNKYKTSINERVMEHLISLNINTNLLIIEILEHITLTVANILCRDIEAKTNIVIFTCLLNFILDYIITCNFNKLKVIKKSQLTSKVQFLLVSIIYTAIMYRLQTALQHIQNPYVAILEYIGVICLFLTSLAICGYTATIRECSIEDGLYNLTGKIVEANNIELVFKDKVVQYINPRYSFITYNNSIITVHNIANIWNKDTSQYILVPENITKEDETYITHIIIGNNIISTKNIQEWV